jgi:Fe-S cluster assembly protein SufB
MGSSIETLVNREYQHGFVTDVESDTVPPGLSEEVVALISQKKGGPQWLLDWRLKAYRRWLTMSEPAWPNVKYPKIDFQDIIYYSAPKSVKPLQSLAEVDPELLRTYEKLSIVVERKGKPMTMDYVIR